MKRAVVDGAVLEAAAGSERGLSSVLIGFDQLWAAVCLAVQRSLDQSISRTRAYARVGAGGVAFLHGRIPW